MNTPALEPCPGCGGRNPRGALFCDWCARPFFAAGRQIDPRWVQAGFSLLLGTLVAVVVLLAVLNAARPTPAARPAATPTAAAAAILPAPSPTLAAEPTATPTPPGPSPTPQPSLPPPPTPEPEPPRTARIANTGGAGAHLRREPSPTAPSVTALREGTQVEDLNQEQVTAARVWRLVRDSRGIEGWVRSDLLEFE